MVFGSQSAISDTFNQEDSDTETQQALHSQPETQQEQATTEDNDPSKPLQQEVMFVGPGKSKNAGGTRIWICKHCNGKFTSSYTRIHTHFFGAPIGKKPDIKRCPVIIQDREKYQTLLNKVKLTESGGVSKSLKNSIVTKSKSSSSKRPLEEAFGVMERNMVDLKIIRGLCANGIPFNVLRNPHFLEMVSAIKKAPDGYKPPSSEKARMVLLDECVRDVEKELTPFKDTWYSQEMQWENLDDDTDVIRKEKMPRVD